MALKNDESVIVKTETTNNNNSSNNTNTNNNNNTKNFVYKLFDEIEENSNKSHLIFWNEEDEGKSFVIKDSNLFSVTILPRLFKHSNYASFVRQLNKYGFHKIKQQNPVNINNSKKDGRSDLLKNIKRQESSSANKDANLHNKMDLLLNDENSSILLDKLLKLEKRFNDISQKQEERIKYLEIELNDLKSKNSNNIPSSSTKSQENQQQQQQQNIQPHFYHGLSPNIEILPEEQEEQEKQEQEISTKKLPPGFHILLCEDDDICIQICKKFLKKLNCKTTVVNDGLSCIQNLKDFPTRYDLILMDIIIPQLDGTTTTAVIRSMDAKIPIIAMTGNVNEDDLLQYLQNGMTDVLAKPFNRRDLQDMLVRYLGQSVPREDN
ncbi:hypothetical protein ACO0SA_002200 [Hanseniaspora valbyensis]